VIVVVARVEVPYTVSVPDAVIFPPTLESPLTVVLPTKRLPTVSPEPLALLKLV
jgi:hypothetical protein